MSNLPFFNRLDQLLEGMKTGINEGDSVSDKLIDDLIWLHTKLQTIEEVKEKNLAKLMEIVSNLENWINLPLQSLNASLNEWVKKANNEIVLFSNISLYEPEVVMSKLNEAQGVEEIEVLTEKGHEIVKIPFNYSKYHSERQYSSCFCTSHGQCSICFRPECAACSKKFDNFKALISHLNKHKLQKNTFLKFGGKFMKMSQIDNPDLLFPESISFQRLIVMNQINLKISIIY